MKVLENEINARRQRISEEIAAALKASGLSKKAFAQKMNRQPSEVTKWLSGRHNFTSDLLAEISCVLGAQISGVDAVPEVRSLVSGFGPAGDDSALHDAGTLMIDNIDLPDDVAAKLGEKAGSMGITLRQYIRKVLCEKADEKRISAYDFCGIWDEEYPDAGEIHALRTSNTIKEL